MDRYAAFVAAQQGIAEPLGASTNPDGVALLATCGRTGAVQLLQIREDPRLARSSRLWELLTTLYYNAFGASGEADAVVSRTSSRGGRVTAAGDAPASCEARTFML